MPGWIWICLVVFLLLVLVGGTAYVFWRGRRALRHLSPVTKRVQKDLSQIREATDQPSGRGKLPVLARPLEDVRMDYEQAHMDLLRHKMKRREQRDASAWKRWSASTT